MSDQIAVRRWWDHSPDAHAAETLADMRRYTDDGLAPVSCATCATVVLVKKNSAKHTSVQWTSDAASCPEIAAKLAEGIPPAQILGCSELKRSIAEAVRAGLVAVPDD